MCLCSVDSVAIEDMPSIDKYILGRFSELVAEVTAAFEAFQFFRASQVSTRFPAHPSCVSDVLSAGDPQVLCE